MVAEILERDKATSKREPARTVPSDLPEDIRRDLIARPVRAGARRVYNKAFKMPRKVAVDAAK